MTAKRLDLRERLKAELDRFFSDARMPKEELLDRLVTAAGPGERQEIPPEVERQVVAMLHVLPRIPVSHIAKRLGISPWLVQRTAREEGRRQATRREARQAVEHGGRHPS